MRRVVGSIWLLIVLALAVGCQGKPANTAPTEFGTPPKDSTKTGQY